MKCAPSEPWAMHLPMVNMSGVNTKRLCQTFHSQAAEKNAVPNKSNTYKKTKTPETITIGREALLL